PISVSSNHYLSLTAGTVKLSFAPAAVGTYSATVQIAADVTLPGSTSYSTVTKNVDVTYTVGPSSTDYQIYPAATTVYCRQSDSRCDQRQTRVQLVNNGATLAYRGIEYLSAPALPR